MFSKWFEFKVLFWQMSDRFPEGVPIHPSVCLAFCPSVSEVSSLLLYPHKGDDPPSSAPMSALPRPSCGWQQCKREGVYSSCLLPAAGGAEHHLKAVSLIPGKRKKKKSPLQPHPRLLLDAAALVWTSDPSVICNVSDPIYTFTKGACQRPSISYLQRRVGASQAPTHTHKGTVAPFSWWSQTWNPLKPFK